MADNNTIARPYAQAIFELAKDAGELSAWSASLDVAGQLLADADWLSTSALRNSVMQNVSSSSAACSKAPAPTSWLAATSVATTS